MKMQSQISILTSLIAVLLLVEQSFAFSLKQYQEQANNYVHSPSSRQVEFKYVYGIEGNVTNPRGSFANSQSSKLEGVNATISLDAGLITAGHLTFNAKSICNSNKKQESKIGIAFAENVVYAARDSDLSHSLKGGKDASLNITLPCDDYKQIRLGEAHTRGSFRYVTFFVHDGSGVELKDAKVDFNASPDVADNELGNYSGWFHSSDELLNKIFYAAVYTIQLCRIGAGNARFQPPEMPEFATGWNNSGPLPPLGPEDVAIIDGARRDRNVWPGDYAIAIPASFYSQNHDNLKSAKNGLRTLVALQNSSTDLFPYYGPPLANPSNVPPESDTYHLWTLVSLYDYWRLSGDSSYLEEIWPAWKKGIKASLAKIDDGLFNVTGTNDWGRIGTNSHNTQANMILAAALQGGVEMASKVNDENESKSLNEQLASLTANITTRLWDEGYGAYKDNDTAAGAQIHPQDGNSLAIQFGIEQDTSRRASISKHLASLVNEFGAVNPEAIMGISPFISSLQLEAHFLAGDNAAAYKLLRTMWGYMLNRFSNETLVEGFYHDGSLHYPFYGNLDSYVSHVHAWSTGPITSLMSGTIGLSNITSIHKDWVFSPAIIDSHLEYASGGFNVPKVGDFAASWTVSPNGNSYDAIVQAPSSIKCTLKLELPPAANGSVSSVSVSLNNVVVFEQGKSIKTNQEKGHFDENTKLIILPNIAMEKQQLEINVSAFPSGNFSARASDPSPGRNVTDSSSFARRWISAGWGTAFEVYNDVF